MLWHSQIAYFPSRFHCTFIITDKSFFSPSRIVAAKIQILDNLDDVRTERHNKMVRSNTRPKIKSPIRPGPSRALCLINKPRTRGQVKVGQKFDYFSNYRVLELPTLQIRHNQKSPHQWNASWAGTKKNRANCFPSG